jgi:TatD DNase family protein
MPLVIHTRAASADTVALMQEENARDAGGVMHCFTETWDVARAALDLGFHISLSGSSHSRTRMTSRTWPAAFRSTAC